MKKRKKKKGKIILGIILAVIVIGIVVAVYQSKKNPIVIMQTVQTTKVTKGDLQELIQVTGTINGAESMNLYAPASGTIKEVSARTGDEVQAGTLLFTYDTDELEKELYKAKLQNERTQIAYDNTLDNNKEGNGKVKEAKTNIAVLEQQIKDHENYLKNLQKDLSDYQAKASDDVVLQSYNLKKRQAQLQALLASLTPGSDDYNQAAKDLEGVVDSLEKLSLQQSLSGKPDYVKDLEKKITEESETIADLQEYKMRMESQKSTGEASVLDNYSRRQLEIDMELTDLSYQTLLEEAEIAREGVSTKAQGVVTGINVAPGTPVSAGMTLATMERTDTLRATASATKYSLERIGLGQKVDVAIGDRTYPAEITHIDRMASMGSLNTMAVAFEATLLEKDEKIYIGSEAKLTVYTNEAKDALLLTTEALNANKDGDFVYVVVGGKIVKKPVTVGIISNGVAEIKSGITEADEIVKSYSCELEEGMEVIATPAE